MAPPATFEVDLYFDREFALLAENLTYTVAIVCVSEELAILKWLTRSRLGPTSPRDFL